jgi:hypothetical protein
MADPFLNKKYPQDPTAAKKSNPEYPWMSGHSDRNGRYQIAYADPDKPNESFDQTFNHDGSTKTNLALEDSKDNGVSYSLENHTIGYSLGGKSGTTDSHQDAYNGATNRTNVAGGEHKNVGGDQGIATGGSKSSSTGGGEAKGTSGKSLADNYRYVSGDNTVRYDGSEYIHRDGNSMTTMGGSKYEVLKNGEWGLNVQSGNWDIQVDAGQGRLFVQQPLLIESPAKITFKVGGSTITMEPAQITLVSDRIDHNP